MRVVSGTAGGLKLAVPQTDLRPTMDRVKAAIFSSLQSRIVGARVLDLFAGTGALGIEALSRGAAFAMFVEENGAAVRTIEQNFVATKLRGPVRQQEVFAFLESTAKREQFDIVFADPPYEKTKTGGEFTRLLLENRELAALLEPDGLFVLEKRPAEKTIESTLWEIVRAKTYGATEVLFLKHANASHDETASDE